MACRARQTDVFGTMLPVIDLGDLIIAKVLAGRPKDIDDARALWKLHGDTVNADRIRHTLQLLEEALAQGDLVSTFERFGPPA